MIQSPSFYQNFVQSLPSAAGVEIHRDFAFIRCPFHKGGQERTPSMKLSFVAGKRYQPGSGRCFACNHTFTLDEIASAWGLKGYAASNISSEIILEVSDSDTDVMLGKAKETFGLDMSSMLPWDKTLDWRGIKGTLVSKVGGRLYSNPDIRANQLYLPVFVDFMHIGGIRANIVKQGKRNYFNTKGSWASDVLFPYDYVKEHSSSRIIVLVEGPRDALNLLQHGIPALALLGAGNWCKRKELLTLGLDPKFVVTALDPDEAGIAGTKKIFASLQNLVDIKMFKMTEGEDPGNLSLVRIKHLKRILARLT